MLHFLFKGFTACYVKHFKRPLKRHVLPISFKRTCKCLNVVCFHITFIWQFFTRTDLKWTRGKRWFRCKHTEPAFFHEPVIYRTKNWKLEHFIHYITSFISSLFIPQFPIYSVFFSKAPSLVRFYQKTCLFSLPKPPSCLFFIFIFRSRHLRQPFHVSLCCQSDLWHFCPFRHSFLAARWLTHGDQIRPGKASFQVVHSQQH